MNSPIWILIIIADFLINTIYGELTGQVPIWIFDPLELFGRAVRLVVIPFFIYLNNRIKIFYGIDLRGNKQTNNSKNRFEPIFSSRTAFHRFQQESYDLMTDYRFSILAVIIGIAIGMNEWLTLTQSVTWSNLLLDFGFGLFYIVYENIFSIGYISGLLLLFQIVITLKSIGNRDLNDLKINKFENFDFSQKIEFDNRYEIVQFNINQFKRRTKVVASFPIPIALISISIAMILNINFIITKMIGYLEGEYLFGTIFPYFLQVLGLNFILMAACFVLFFYPQNTLKKIIYERKMETIFEFEAFYETKLMKWIQILDKTDSKASDEKTRLEKEMEILSRKIEELNDINPWPFEVKQGMTVIGASIFPLIAFLVSVLASVLFRVLLINLLS